MCIWGIIWDIVSNYIIKFRNAFNDNNVSYTFEWVSKFIFTFWKFYEFRATKFTIYYWHKWKYLLIDLDVNLFPLSVAANQRPGFSEILHCDWLPPKVGQDWLRGRLVDIDRRNLVNGTNKLYKSFLIIDNLI